MDYKFPIIEHIDQVREAIKSVGGPEFQEYNRGTHIVFNYHVTTETTFPPVKSAGGSAKMRELAQKNKSILRECRGLIFNPEGQVISRRFHKFFNLNERQETEKERINWNKDFILLDKLDGSMITPLKLSNGIFWATKMGVTDIGCMCHEYVKRNNRYAVFAEMFIANGYTPIFEYMSPRTRIVIDHSEESLVLLAMRENITGEYVSYTELVRLAEKYNIPVVQSQKQYYLENVNELKNAEGLVVRFSDGHMVKLKTEWYCAIHKARENLLFEKNIIKLILEEKIDDILPFLPEPDKIKINKYREDLIHNIDLLSFTLHQRLANYEKTLTRKDYAVKYSQEANDSSFIKQIIFACWGTNVKVRDKVIEYILKHTNSQTQVDSIRDIIGVTW